MAHTTAHILHILQMTWLECIRYLARRQRSAHSAQHWY